MKNTLAIIFSFVSLGCMLASCAVSKTSSTNIEATFHSSHIGGGGYITKLVQHPTETGILYAQSDVGGLFKTTDGCKSWTAVNNGLTKSRDHYTHTIVLDEKNPNILYRACGELRGHQFLGHIYKSANGGDSWQLLTDKIDFFGTGPTRMLGPLIAIHPNNSNIVVAGGYSKGLWVSEDQGKTWAYKGLKGKRISFVRFDPFSKTDFYVGTMSDNEMLLLKGETPEKQKQALEDLMDFPRGEWSELYRSSDLGKSLTSIYRSKQHGFNDILFVNSEGVILIGSTNGVLRSTDYGKSFNLIDEKYMPRGITYITVTMSPVDGTIYTSPRFGKMNCSIYYSKDLGVTWLPLSTNVQKENMHEFPDHLSAPSYLSSAVSHVYPDRKDAEKFYITNWWGVTVSYDRGKNLYGHNFTGLEMTCVEDVKKHPAVADKVVLSIADHRPMISTDAGKSFKNIKVKAAPSRAFTTSAHDPSLLMWSAGRVHLNTGTPLMRSPDDGQTATSAFRRKGQSYILCLLEDTQKKGRFWMMNEGSIVDESEAAGIYRSDDFGVSWKKVTNPYPDYIKAIPHQKEFIEQDHLTIVPYQFKNGSGSNRKLAMDYHRPNTLYIGEFTEGLYRTDNAGETWIDISKGLPFKTDKEHVLSQILTDPDVEGSVYAAFWKAGLWHSADFGQTWRKIYPTRHTAFNAISLSIDHGVMAVACSENVHSSVDAALLISFDRGKTWADIYDKKLGALNFTNISLDAKKQRIYAATNGNGVFYIDYKIKNSPGGK